jgi:nicotinamidase-related amidase
MMIIQKELSGMLLIDVQEKLTPLVMHAPQLIERCAWLMRLANTMNVPQVVTEQYPRGLGQTVETLRTLAHPYDPIEKVHFSCFHSEPFLNHWQALNKPHVVIAGIETHVCVLQSALDMKQHTDWHVFVVVDAVSSRHELDHNYGLKRMKQAGIELVTAEMVFFEWVKCAGTKEFKALSQSFLTSQ